jgi:hypothetical protein
MIVRIKTKSNNRASWLSKHRQGKKGLRKDQTLFLLNFHNMIQNLLIIA